MGLILFSVCDELIRTRFFFFLHTHTRGQSQTLFGAETVWENNRNRNLNSSAWLKSADDISREREKKWSQSNQKRKERIHVGDIWTSAGGRNARRRDRPSVALPHWGFPLAIASLSFGFFQITRVDDMSIVFPYVLKSLRRRLGLWLLILPIYIFSIDNPSHCYHHPTKRDLRLISSRLIPSAGQ